MTWAPNTKTDQFRCWTIYEHPKDYPEHFVVREFTLSLEGPVPSKDVHLFPSLGAAREPLLKSHFYRLGRMPADEPQIVETWIR